MHLIVAAGETCQAFMKETLVDLPVDDVQCDKIWGFVGMKEKTRERNGLSQEYSDCYTFTVIERTSKLLIAWHVGKRSSGQATVRRRTEQSYVWAIPTVE